MPIKSYWPIPKDLGTLRFVYGGRPPESQRRQSNERSPGFRPGLRAAYRTTGNPASQPQRARPRHPHATYSKWSSSNCTQNPASALIVQRPYRVRLALVHVFLLYGAISLSRRSLMKPIRNTPRSCVILRYGWACPPRLCCWYSMKLGFDSSVFRGVGGLWL